MSADPVPYEVEFVDPKVLGGRNIGAELPGIIPSFLLKVEEFGGGISHGLKDDWGSKL